jgi:hypothetical protein
MRLHTHGCGSNDNDRALRQLLKWTTTGWFRSSDEGDDERWHQEAGDNAVVCLRPKVLQYSDRCLVSAGERPLRSSALVALLHARTTARLPVPHPHGSVEGEYIKETAEREREFKREREVQRAENR